MAENNSEFEEEWVREYCEDILEKYEEKVRQEQNTEDWEEEWIREYCNDENIPDECDDNECCDIEIWMYWASAFFPILNWILIGAYVCKGDTRSAYKLWWPPAIIQVAIVLIILFIIL